MKSQKQAVIDEVVSMYGQMSVPFVQGGTNALAGLPEPALETIKANIGKAILAGTVEYSKDKSNPNEVMAYARSMVMKKVFPCCCAVQNEGIACFSQENVEYIKANSDKQILSFDSDVTGVANSQQITKLFDFGYLNVPKRHLKEGIKDWADLAKAYGLKRIEDYLRFKTIL